MLKLAAPVNWDGAAVVALTRTELVTVLLARLDATSELLLTGAADWEAAG